MLRAALFALTLSLLAPLDARAAIEPPGPFAEVRLNLELGFLSSLHHTIQYGKNGTRFDWVSEGGQDTLFFFARPSAELILAQRHAIIFVYQPVTLPGEVRLRRDVVIDNATFLAGTALNVKYGFDFYRLSYLYDLLRGRHRELSIGLTMQIRNANVVFSAADGSLRRSFRNIGPVPALKARGGYRFGNGFFVGGEVDAMYAPVKYLNGGKSDVEGAIIDLNARAGYRLRRSSDVFLNVRYLAGGASGTSSDTDTVGDGYVSNWLHFLTVSLGATWSSAAL